MAPVGPTVPPWLAALADRVPTMSAVEMNHVEPPAGGGKQSAVLILFGDGPSGPDVLLIERSGDLRHHAGQPAFPGGAIDAGDDGPVAAALREAVEETGLDPAGVDIVAVLPTLWIPPSGFFVTPVLAWWREPSAVSAVDPAEVAAVLRAPVSVLVDPANRFRMRHPSGHLGPAFEVDHLLVWGFTANVLDRLLELAGFAVAWDHTQVRDLD
jgi:8-oxo-dGTP pyrophosphatase MutT (NUDIX family)